MTNEELVVQIQNGNPELYLELWKNVKKLVSKLAYNRYCISHGRGGVEVEDLVQCGYIALIMAVNNYDAATGWKFTTYLTKTLQTEFARAIGYRTSKRDPLDDAIRLDAPLGEDDDDSTYYDIVEDPSVSFEGKTIDDIWIEDLRRELKKAIAAIPEEQGEMIQLRYGKGLSVDQISKSRGIDPKTIRSLEQKGLHSLRKPQIKSALERFVDEETPFYTKWGLHAYNQTGMSAVEHIAIKREKIREQYQREQNAIPEITTWKRSLKLRFWKTRTLGVLSA